MGIYATTQVKPAPLGNAALVLEEKSCGIIHRLSGGAIGAGVVEERVPRTMATTKHLGPPEHEDVSLDFGFAMARPVFDWIAETWKMQAPRRDGSILACNQAMEPKSQRKFTAALITETIIPALDTTLRDASHGLNAIWLNLKFAAEAMSRDKASGAKVSGDPKHPEKKLLRNNFRLQIDGLDCDKVQSIAPFAVKQIVHRVRKGRSSGLVGGTVTFPNLKITFAEVTADSWEAWLDDFVVRGQSSEDKEKKGTLTLLAPDMRQTLATIKLFGLGIFNLSHAPAGSAVEEHHMLATAQLYCQRMEFEPGT
jgi:hypothetical protein